MLITGATGTYGEGHWSPGYAYPYTTFIINASQMYALYILGIFYLETRADLKPLHPLGKFAVVKMSGGSGRCAAPCGDEAPL